MMINSRANRIKNIQKKFMCPNCHKLMTLNDLGGHFKTEFRYIRFAYCINEKCKWRGILRMVE